MHFYRLYIHAHRCVYLLCKIAFKSSSLRQIYINVYIINEFGTSFLKRDIVLSLCACKCILSKISNVFASSRNVMEISLIDSCLIVRVIMKKNVGTSLNTRRF